MANKTNAEPDFDDLPNDEKLFALAERRGNDRNPLLGAEMIIAASKMLKKEPERYGELLNRIAGWSGLSDFRRRVQKLRAEQDANLKRKQAEQQAEERLDDARRRGMPFIAEGKPTVIARDFVAQVMPHLVRTDGEWLDYETNSYAKLSGATIRSTVQAWMASGVNAENGEPCYPNKTDLDHVMNMLEGEVHKDERKYRPPAWFDYWEGIDPAPEMCISAQNGILDTKTGMLMPATPRFFTRNGLTFDYIPDTPEPVEWLKFLDSIWPGDAGRANQLALQEIMGHLLTGDMKYQKVFMLLGPPRAGKGVITRVVTQMVGEDNVAEQSAHDLGERFGLSNLLGKQVLIVPDLRLDRSSKTGKIMELLLNISGGDRVGVDRKFKDYMTERLNTRILIATNKELMLPDQSGAFNARLVPLVFHKSFIGREDKTLDVKLARELPSIFNWALEGLRRLEARVDERGLQMGFVLTPDGEESLKEVSRHSAPLKAFLAECCDRAPGLAISKKGLYDAFDVWCGEHDVRADYTVDYFAKELRVASGYTIEGGRMTLGGENVRAFMGIALLPEAAERLSAVSDDRAAEDF